MLADFGELVTFSPGDVWPNISDDTIDITVIFDYDYVELPGDRVAISSDNPVALGRSTDLAGAVRNSMLQRLDGSQYKVASVQPDGTGFTLLELEGPR